MHLEERRFRCCPQRNVPTMRRLTSFQLATSSLSATEEASEIHDMSFLSIMEFDGDIRKELYADDALHWRAHDQRVRCVGTTSGAIKVVAPPARRYSVMIGGCTPSLLCIVQRMWTSLILGLPRVHDASHVRDVLYARHVRGEPGRFVSVCVEMHKGHRDGLLKRCVAHSSHLRCVPKPMTVFRETLQQNKTLRVIKMDLGKKCLEMSAETAEKNDDHIESHEQSGKCLKLDNHDDSTIRAKIAELLDLNTSESEDEQFSDIFFRLREYRCRVLFPILVRKKGLEVLHMANLVDEYAVRLLKEFVRRKLKPTTKEFVAFHRREFASRNPFAPSEALRR